MPLAAQARLGSPELHSSATTIGTPSSRRTASGADSDSEFKFSLTDSFGPSLLMRV